MESFVYLPSAVAAAVAVVVVVIAVVFLTLSTVAQESIQHF